MAKAHSFGLMADNILVIGLTVNSMVKVYITLQMAIREKEFGKEVEE